MRMSEKVSDPFFRKVLTMLSGNAVALILPFLLAPIISRLFSPSEIGTYELFARILATLAIIATLRFELAVILPKKETEALALLKLSIQVMLVISIVVALGVYAFSDKLVDFTKNEGLASLLPWLPLILLLSAFFKLMQNYAIRSDRFTFLSSNRILTSASNHGGKALMGFGMPNAFGLLIGHFLGVLAPLVHFLGSKRFSKAIISGFRQSTAGLWKRYRDFPLINTTHALSDEAKNLALFAIISIYYGEVVLGLFGLMIRYLRVPIDLLGSSLGSVFMQNAAQRLNEEKSVSRMVTRIVIVMAGIGIVPFGSIFFFGEELFAWFFGDDWTRAGKFAAIISPWLFANFIISPVSSLPVLLNRQKTFFLISLIMNGCVVAAMLVMSESGSSIEKVLQTITFVHLLFLVVLLGWFLKISKATS